MQRRDFGGATQTPPSGGDQRSEPSGERHGPGPGDRPASDRPVGDRPPGDRPFGNRPVGDRPRGDRPYGDRPYGDRPFGDRSRGDRPHGDRPPGDRPGGRFGGRGRDFRSRRKVCAFCVDHIREIDYKDVSHLRRYLSDRAKIEPRRKTGVCAKHQRRLSTALKNARQMALLPYTAAHIRGA